MLNLWKIYYYIDTFWIVFPAQASELIYTEMFSLELGHFFLNQSLFSAI